jgi:RimJ/RimL family protein N-acetyltransferase
VLCYESLNSAPTDPTERNDASIRLCLKNGMKLTSTSINNPYGKPQLFHEITREEWWARNRPGREIKSPWEGKEACRW